MGESLIKFSVCVKIILSIGNWTVLAPEELFIRATDKESWAVIIANV